MFAALHRVADAVLKRIQRSSPYYKRFNNTLAYRYNKVYARYGRECAQRYAEVHGPLDLPPTPLETQPAIRIPGVYPAEKARALSAKIGELIDRRDPCVLIPPREHGGGQAQILNPVQVLGVDILDAMRSPALHRALLQIFRGHYRVKGTTVWRTFPTDQADRASWLWHCDTIPPNIYKVFIHLTPVNAALGATEFMDRKDTMAYRRAGYFGQYGKERRGDLDIFAKQHGLPFRPIHIDAETGDATIFNQNYFHRAVPPRTSFRDILQFLIIPSLVSWEEDYRRDPARLLTSSGDYPKDPRATGEDRCVKMQ